jgi:hypothetical protein
MGFCTPKHTIMDSKKQKQKKKGHAHHMINSNLLTHFNGVPHERTIITASIYYITLLLLLSMSERCIRDRVQNKVNYL